jgi:prevent-host-death family protein
LSRYLAIVRDSGEVLITDHGRPVARVIRIEGRTSFERLAEIIAAGELTAAEQLGPEPDRSSFLEKPPSVTVDASPNQSRMGWPS